MLRRLIRNLRGRSKESRNNIALGIAIVFTSLVFVVWMYNLPVKLASIQEKRNPNGQDNSPGFSSLFNSLSEEISEIRKANSVAEPGDDAAVETTLSSSTLEAIQNRYASSSAFGDFFLDQERSALDDSAGEEDPDTATSSSAGE